MTTCKTISHLQCLATGASEDFKGAAAHALAIVSDITAHGIQGLEVKFLYDLLDDLYDSVGVHLFEHLREGEADCEICSLLKQRLLAIQP